jgi:hypothetical protein
LAVAGTVQVDDMEALCTRILPALSDGQGIVVENGLASVVSLLEANATPTANVKSGDDLHRT